MPTMGLPVSRSMGQLDGDFDGDVLTIGVAIEVPDPHGRQLRRWRADFGDPMAEVIPAHVTLLPPTLVAADTTDEIAEHLALVAKDTAPFEIKLSGTGSFRPISPVVFVRLVDGSESCDALQQRVRTGPLRRELSFPYHPHVTVAHHLEDAALDRAERALDQYSADFTVKGLALYEHGRDGVWRLQRSFGFDRTGG